MARDVVRLIVEGLFEHADPTRAVQERRYLKSDREFLGVSVPDGRRVVRAVVGSAESADGPFDAAGVRSIVEELWSGDLFESRRAAVEVLMFRSAVLGPNDLGFLAGMIRAGETWALVDPLAGDVAGSIVAQEMTDHVGAVLDEWSVDESFWLRAFVDAGVAALAPPTTTVSGSGSGATRTRCSANASSSSARRSVGCCATSRSDGPTRCVPGSSLASLGCRE